MTGSVLYASFSGFDNGCNPEQSLALPWDPDHAWWGIGTIEMGTCNGSTWTLKLWLICPPGGSSCESFVLRYELYEEDVLHCDWSTDTSDNPWTPDSCSCSPLHLDFKQHSFGNCLGGNLGKGHVIITA